MGFHIASKLRKQLNLDEFKFEPHGEIQFDSSDDIYHFYEVTHQALPGITSPEIRLFSLVVASVKIVVDEYHRIEKSSLQSRANTFIKENIPNSVINAVHQTFSSDEPSTIDDLLVLCFENKNTAAESLKLCFDHKYWDKSFGVENLTSVLNQFYNDEKRIGKNQQTLPHFILEPIQLFPNSLKDQLHFILANWAEYLGDFIYLIQKGLDQSTEEMKIRGFGGNAIDELPDYSGLDETEGFSSDTDWMPNVVLIAKNALVWMDQLSKSYQRRIYRLDQIPEDEIRRLADFGINAVWLIGVWKRSQASKTIKHRMGNTDAEASAYSLSEYEIAEDIGGWEALDRFKQLCANNGIRIAGDMVPNHTGLDSSWLAEHPDWYISSDHPPFPGYSYSSGNVSSDGRIQVILEDHYYAQSDAAVTFKLIHNVTNKVSYVYHGNDGTTMPWNDTAQLNYLNPDVREAIIQTIIKVARAFPIIRFDAAMTLAKKHIQRLWFPVPGEGGGIPSRWNHSMSHEAFHQAIPVEFWREVVDRVAQEVPDTLLLAEAFWMMEGYFVRTLGMHRVYNSAFMNMLKMERNADYRSLIMKTLDYDPQILKRYVNFLNNPDEETAVMQFGKMDKYFGVTILMCTFPGLPMFGHGQIEGFEEKYGMEFRKSYWDEAPDQGFVDYHHRIITPILKNRHLFSEVDHFQLFALTSTNGTTNENVFAFTNGREDKRALVLYNNSAENASGSIHHSAYSKVNEFGTVNISHALNIPEDENTYVILQDMISGLEYLRQANGIHQNGLYVELTGYQHQVFLEIQTVRDNALGQYKQLCDLLSGRGVPSIAEAMIQIVHHNTDVLFVSAEVSPFSKAGGLADVAGSLPGELMKLGKDTLVVTPLYSQINTALHNIIPYSISGRVQMGDTAYTYDLFYRAATPNEPEYLFIYNDHFFHRDGIYVDTNGEGFPDNNARYFFFQYVILDLIQKNVITTKLVHCNDHHSALLPRMIRNRKLNIPTLLTIHNFHYQGWFGPFDLPLLNPMDVKALKPGLETYNALEEGILAANQINSVSPKYVHELLTQETLSFGLYKTLRKNRSKFSGILNGVNYNYWSPETDPHLEFHYSEKSLSGKAKNKKQLLQACGFENDLQTPIIGMISRLVVEKGYDLILDLLEKLVKQNVRLVFLGTGDKKIADALHQWSEKHPEKIHYISDFNEKMAHLIEAGADMFLMPSLFEPCGLNQIYSLKYGTIPIVHFTGGLADTITNWDGKTGTGFMFKTYSEQALYRIVKKALTGYNNKKIWKKIMSNAMKQDYSWNRSATQYVKLYQSILGENHE